MVHREISVFRVNNMKKFVLPIISLFVIGCDSQPPDQDVQIKTETINTAKIGEACTDNLCGDGLTCNDQNICVSKDVDPTITCGTEQKPVCGLKERVKNGYLNECEARRHKTTVLYEGLCKLDPTVKGRCDRSATVMGNCETEFVGYEHTSAGCSKIRLTGCSAEIPFNTQQACEKTCEKSPL